MKKSDLNKYIKEQITSILQEASKEDVINQAELNKELEKTDALMSKMDMKEEEEAEAPAGDKETQKRASKQDKIISAFKSSFPDGLKAIIKKAKEGDKDALAKLKSKQDVIKAYNKLKSV